MNAVRAAIIGMFAAAPACLAAVEDIAIPLENGSVLVRASFIERNTYGGYVPYVSAKVLNHTDYSWVSIKISLTVGALCDGVPRQWEIPVVIKSLGVFVEYRDMLIPLAGKVDGCTTEIIKGRLVSADKATGSHYEISLPPPDDLSNDLMSIRLAQDARKAEEEKQAEVLAAADKKRADAINAEYHRKLATAEAAEAARLAAIAKLPLMATGISVAFVGNDRKCAEEFTQAAAMEGLEKRKRIAELVSYNCGFIADSPVHVAVISNIAGYATIKIAEGEYKGKSGWIPAAWINGAVRAK